ncbi:MAG: PQQ-binding-like beta-propeller repeat protein [Pirellulaceae bacterium]
MQFSTCERLKHSAFVLRTLLIVALATQATRADDWPLGRGDAAGTGATSQSLPADMELLWEVDVLGLGFDAGPIIAQGKVFAADHDGRVLAIDLVSGDELWRIELDTGFVSSPAFPRRSAVCW